MPLHDWPPLVSAHHRNQHDSPDRNLKVVPTLLGHSSVAVTPEYVKGNMNSLRMALEETFAGQGWNLSQI